MLVTFRNVKEELYKYTVEHEMKDSFSSPRFLLSPGSSVEGAEIYNKNLSGWSICWECEGPYRHWCLQEQENKADIALIVMFNPGSLRGDGKYIKKDTTLRILREVFDKTGFSPLVVNLFDFSTTSTAELFSNWCRKDSETLIYSRLDFTVIKAVLYAYGDYQNGSTEGPDIVRRIEYVKQCFSDIPEIIVSKNKSGTPKHPLAWQRERLKSRVREKIANFRKQN